MTLLLYFLFSGLIFDWEVSYLANNGKLILRVLVPFT